MCSFYYRKVRQSYFSKQKLLDNYKQNILIKVIMN